MTDFLRARPSYADQARSRLRDAILDSLSDLLHAKEWSAITMADVAGAAGVSRQTLYNEFRSRLGLAEGYAHRLVDRLVDVVSVAIDANVDQVFSGLRQALALFLEAIAADPLVRSLHTGEPASDLLRIVTVDAQPIIEHGVTRLAKAVMSNWMQAPAEQAGIFARAVVRLALSYVATPPEPEQDTATDLALLLTPYAELAIRR